MENFVVSARKYRPSTFESVVGQQSITNTLKNAIKNNLLAQAFLFCGPRGVGKTTCARILAKTINCLNPLPNAEACNECESCKSFNNGTSFNIYELDAASNNSVDEMRNLVDQVRIPPFSGKYKVYIFDEVHMLSQSAFNAFLKTLEEPPPYVKYILATTEKHKILPTILSRCQVFDFRRIRIEDIVNHLAYVASQENIEADIDALHIIANKADGALRDALSIFDQLVSFEGNKLTYQTVIDNLNVLDYDYYFKIADYSLNGDIANSLTLFNQIIEKGFDGQHFITGLSNHYRSLLVCQDKATVALLEIGDNLKEKYIIQSKQYNSDQLLYSLEICSNTDLNYRNSNNKQLLVEIMLVQLCSYNKKKNYNIAENEEKQSTEKKNQVEIAVEKENSIKQKSKEEPIYINNPTLKGIDKSIVNYKIKDTIRSVVEESEHSEENTVDNEIDENIKLNESEFLNYWNECLLLINEKSTSLYVTLSKNQPVLENNNIILTIENKLQENQIKEIRNDIVNFLKSKMNVPFRITTIIEVKENSDQPLIYGGSEKFKILLQKNPSLKNFVKTLSLDVEF
jgi:DNA polymerase-3 subunit gamma/tau